MKIDNIDALEKIKKIPDNSQDIIFADPPYALGSTVFIDKDGKPKYNEAKDFMNKWDMPDHTFWEEFFKECNRVLKYGGRILLFGIDRQLMLFQYYAVNAQLKVNQSLYWTFVNSFPKATDVSKTIDKRLGIHRTVIGKISDFSLDGANRNNKNHKNHKESAKESSSHEYGFNANSTWDVDVTKSNSELGQKYEGYKYSKTPFKQVMETIMVFQKNTKKKSVLDDIMAFEGGDETISPSIWNIDAGRIPTDDSLDGGATSSTNAVVSQDGFERPWMNDKEKLILHMEKMKEKVEHAESLGRYPSQLFIDDDVSSKLNKQDMESKFFHNIGYLDDEVDLTLYTPKVSTKERNMGVKENKHPTLKPIKLINNIAKLLKTPNKQSVFFPFAGSGSEIIGFIKAGFNKELFSASELNQHYIDIAYDRISYWEKNDIVDYSENDLTQKETITAKDITDSLF